MATKELSEESVEQKLGGTIKFCREARSLSIDQLAELAGVEPEQINRLEEGYLESTGSELPERREIYEFTPGKKHAAVSMLLNGGILTTILNEAMVRMVRTVKNIPGAISEISTVFHGPTPANMTYKVVSWIVSNREPYLTRANIYTKTGVLAAEASGTFRHTPNALFESECQGLGIELRCVPPNRRSGLPALDSRRQGPNFDVVEKLALALGFEGLEGLVRAATTDPDEFLLDEFGIEFP